MHLTSVMAMSVNGRITRGSESNVEAWTSSEDKQQFLSTIQGANLMIMGAATFEVKKAVQRLSPGLLRVVLTSDPEKYREYQVDGQREFYNQPPAELVAMLEGRGYDSGLLLGGAATNKGFFEAGLVDELLLTIEPKLFGQGRPLITEGDFDCQLHLEEVQRLNDAGTLLLRYAVLK